MMHSDELDGVLAALPDKLRAAIQPFIRTRLTQASLEHLRILIEQALNAVRIYWQIQDRENFMKWVSLRINPEDGSQVLCRLTDPYNAPAWLWRVFEGLAKGGPIE